MTDRTIMENHYLCNPDVVLREEDESGGLLFNPDTNQVKVVNTTGLFIWKLFCSENTPQNAANAILETFEDVPQDQIDEDLQEFLDELLRTGFIGEVQS